MKDQRGGPKAQQLMVAVRIRPMNDAELDEEASVIAHKLGEQMVVLMDPTENPDDILRANRSREKTFIFDKVFDAKTTQEEVYVSTTKKLIEGVISGYNATVFAYGATGAGKTYTMLGMDCEPGIYIQTLNNLFKSIEETSDSMHYNVSMSYLEIYNELIRDLLNPSSGFLDLREDSRGSVQVAGITEVSTNNAKKIMQLLTKGNKQRTQEPTAANKTSSRSHAVLQVKVKHTRVKGNCEEVRAGRLFLIDLAGAERASQTQNRGQRLKEGAHINRSLLALGNCITALSEKGGFRAHFVNFRDSKLTRLLKDSLDGNCRTVMIAHISPASTSFEESRTTLIYAYRAKNIKTRVKQNLQNVTYHIAQYTNIIAELRKEIKHLKRKVEQQENKKGNTRDIRDIQAEVQQSSQVYSRQEMDRLRDQLLSAFNEQMKMRRSLMELENVNIELYIDTSRHLLTISDWERMKTWRASTFEKRAANDSGVEDMEADRVEEEEESDFPEPQEVVLARAEISMLLAEQQKTANLKSELEQRLANTELKVSQLEELLPKLISNGDQQEVLTLLCKVHELEVGNTELQAGAICKENLICQKDFVIQRYQQHRSLCEEIIRQQLALIEDHDTPIPLQLRKLCRLYFRELQEGTLNHLVQLHSVMANTLRRQTALSLKDIISILHSPTLLDPESRQSAAQNCGITLSPEALEEITASTKSISLIAARRRSRVHILESSHGGGREKSGSHVLVNILDDPEESKYTQHIYTPDYRILGARSIESWITESQRKDGERDKLLLKRRNDLKKDRLREMSVERKGSKKRSHSFEAVSQGGNSKNTPVHEMDNVSDIGLTQPVQHSKLFLRSKVLSSLSQCTPPSTKVEFLISKDAVDSPLQVLELTNTPPRIVHQSNAGQSRGQILQKRVKGPSGSVNTHQVKAADNLNQRPSAITCSQTKPDSRKRK